MRDRFFAPLWNTLLLLALVAATPPAAATVLVFDQGTGDGASVDPAYGDRVTAEDAGAFHYRMAGGYTPSVEVSYPSGSPIVRASGFGSLPNVLTRGNPSATSLSIRLAADLGKTVQLRIFNLAANPAYPGRQAGDTGIPIHVEVSDSQRILASWTEEALYDGGREVYFSVPLEARELTVTLDFTSLTDPAAADYIGLDNLMFAEERATRFDAALPIVSLDEVSRLLLADLDGDGDDDLVSASRGNGSTTGDVGWSENEGGGVFGLRQIIASDAAASDASTADLDGDGDADVVVTWSGAGKVSWYENLGGGSFGNPVTNEKPIASGLPGAISVETADADADGDLDVLVASPGDGSVRWFKSDGTPSDGGWLAETVASLGSGRDALPEDLDHDGDLDVMAVGESGPLAWYENVGGGSWPARVINGSVPGATGIALGDIDKDGRTDVVMARCGASGADLENRISWHRNVIGDPSADSDGFLGEGFLATGLACPEAVIAADINQNGLLDLIVPSSDPNGSPPFTVVLRRFEARHLFTEPLALPGTGIGTTVAIGDADDDGDPDVYSARSDGVITFSKNRTMHYLSEFHWGGVAGGGFNKLLLSTPPRLNEIASADLNRDGRTDLITGSGILGELQILQHLPFVETATATVTTGVTGLEDMTTADLDGDGFEDIITADTNLSWLRTLGGLPVSFDAERVISPIGFLSVTARDLDRDGDVDLVAGGTSGGTSALLYWFENDGTPTDGGWTAHDLSASLPADNLTGAAFWRVLAVTTEDLNRDGKPDIVAGAGSSCGDNNFGLYGQMDYCGTSAVVWLAGSGGPGATFTAQPQVTTPAGLQTVLAKPHLEEFYRQFGVFQFEDDAAPDLLVGSDEPFVFFQNKLDTPAAPQWPEQGFFIAGFPAESLAAEDFALDGEDDIAFTISSWPFGFEGVGICGDGGASVWGCGNVSTGATNSPTVSGQTVITPRKIIAPDLDGDGDRDWAIAADNFLWTHRNFRNNARFAPISPSPEFADLVSDPLFAYEGEQTVIQATLIVLGARPSDSSALLESFSVQLTDTSLEPGPATNFMPGVPLTSAQANDLIEDVLIYRDNGDGAFDPQSDIVVLTVPQLDLDPLFGIQTLAFNPGDPNMKLAAPVRFWVVARIAADATAHTPKDFRIRLNGFHFGPIFKDVNNGSFLRTEFETGSGWVHVQTVEEINVDAFIDTPDPDPSDGTCDVGTGQCSLRAAIQEANQRPGQDRIDLVPGTFTVVTAGAGEDAGNSGDLDVSDPLGLIIRGAGVGSTFIDGAALDRVFDVLAGGSLTLEDLTVLGGSASAEGGGIRVAAGASLTLTRCAVTGNTATDGGGIWSAGTVTITNTTVSDNTAQSRGGGIRSAGGSLAVHSSTVARNSASEGGGISFDGALDMQNSTISTNQALASGFGPGEGGGIHFCTATIDSLRNNTITANTATADAGVSVPAGCSPTYNLLARNNIIGGNQDTLGSESCGDTILGGGYNLHTGCVTQAGSDPEQLTSSAPLLGPLQANGGPTETHALPNGSLAIDGGFCDLERDQRGFDRADLPSIANFASGDGCDVGAYEVALAEALDQIHVPLRWCALAGSASFDFSSPTVQDDVNEALRTRHELVSENIFGRQAAIRFRSAGNASIPDFPILQDLDTTCGEGNVIIQPEARDFKEFLDIIAQCRSAWEAIDPQITGVTAVNINRFVGPDCVPLDVLGLGGRADPNNVTQQMAAGRVMVVDRVHRLGANPPDDIDRLLAHELGHGAGSLEHGNGLDDNGDEGQCGDGEIDNNDDLCSGAPRFDGDGLLQYRYGTFLTLGQILRMREHILTTMPDLELTPNTSGLADDTTIDPEFANVLDFEFANVLDFEFANVLDFEFANVLDFEFANVLDFEEAEILDFEFANVLDFGMTFTDTSTSGDTLLYASTAGLPWPTPIRPDTIYFWYLDLDESDLTGGQPSAYGFPGGQAEELGVDLIVSVGFSSTCDANNVCSDTVELVAYAWDHVTNDGFDLVYGPVPAEDYIEPLTVGLFQEDTSPDREDQVLGMLMTPRIPNAVVLAAAPPGSGYSIGDPISMEVVTALPCEMTLPDGTEVDCQCTSCAQCQAYPGCEDPTDPLSKPNPYKKCNIEGTDCRDDTDCVLFAGDTCGGEAAYIVADEPGGSLDFQQPKLPSCEVLTPAAEAGELVAITARDFPTTTGRAMKVLVNTVQVGYAPSPLFNELGETSLTAAIPAETLPGTITFTVTLEGLATSADCKSTVEPGAEVACLGDPAAGDADGDGYCDDLDLCPSDPDPGQENSDGDAAGNACDVCPGDPEDDFDLDGICAGSGFTAPATGDNDNCPDVFNPGQEDTDGDGAGDACDPCPFDPLDDADADGICGDADNCPAVANAGQYDADGDGAGDECDVCAFDPADDADGDGVCGDVDNCPATVNSDQADADGDGAGDVCDVCPLDAADDADGDGVCGNVDNCPAAANAGQEDADGDGLGDACDACHLDPANDVDGDGICGDVDNCPEVPNPAPQADTDGDGLGDACDPDPNILGVTAGPAYEGGTATITVLAEPPTPGEPLSYSFDCDDDGSYETANGTNLASCGFAEDGSYQVNVRVATATGEAFSYTGVSVQNVAPTVDAISGPVAPVALGTAVNVSAGFSDPGTLDTHDAVWNWGDGTTSTVDPATSPVSGAHTYGTPGVYTVQLTVNDDDGGSGGSVFQFVVVYDPSGSFVTGGGFINSPPGAYVPDPALEGKGTFGFVSKYKQGSSVPTGNTEFQLHLAGMSFKSTAYEWLVVAGYKAQHKGTGTINGAGNYGFLLFAVDEALTPSTSVDRFRIKIWDKDNGDAIVYDNELGLPDDAEATTDIGGGSIVIHSN